MCVGFWEEVIAEQQRGGKTVQDKDRCHRNALWAAVSNCSVLGNISCHDNGIFTEIDTRTGRSERKDHLNSSTDLTVPEADTSAGPHSVSSCFTLFHN